MRTRVLNKLKRLDSCVARNRRNRTAQGMSYTAKRSRHLIEDHSPEVLRLLTGGHMRPTGLLLALYKPGPLPVLRC